MTEKSVEKRISSIVSSWFYSEPLLFSVCSSHVIIPNSAISVPMRSGKKRIEYSPDILSNTTDDMLAFFLQTEVTRILLGHPYQRKPHNVKPYILTMASDAVIWQLNSSNKKNKKAEYFLELSGVKYLRQNVGAFATYPNMNFEQWYKYILDLVAKAKNGENAGAAESLDFSDFESASELWEEDQEAMEDIKNQVEDSIITDGFGEDGGQLSRAIAESTDFSFDYRRALNHFRQQIVSASRTLTRLRPNRRYGFKAMGSRYERKANVLIAVDVSGSITDQSFEHFVHAIKNFFFLGIIEKIDLIFFDVNLSLSKPIPFSKKVDLDKIKGRGGTNFQVPVDFYAQHQKDYSGMIIFTDGEGNPPKIPAGTNNVLWILDSRLNYEKSRQWISKFCKNQATYLPF